VSVADPKPKYRGFNCPRLGPATSITLSYYVASILHPQAAYIHHLPHLFGIIYTPSKRHCRPPPNDCAGRVPLVERKANDFSPENLTPRRPFVDPNRILANSYNTSIMVTKRHLPEAHNPLLEDEHTPPRKKPLRARFAQS
jgi:hypothetical protein